MKRRLVLTNEAAGHPFRRSLPPPADTPARRDDEDWKLFLLSFIAFFICFYTFLL
jgi:NADH:ubiquinone oxidoreductase subunit C